MVGSVASNTSLQSGLQSFMTSFDFLKLFAAELEYQNPLEPMGNSELMAQVGQMTNIQMISDMSAKLSSTMDSNSVLQASGLIGRGIEFAQTDGTLAADIVSDVRMDSKGVITLGTLGGASVGLASIRRVM